MTSSEALDRALAIIDEQKAQEKAWCDSYMKNNPTDTQRRREYDAIVSSLNMVASKILECKRRMKV